MNLNVVVTEAREIQQQLKIEEALLRANNENWCLINNGSIPSIVLGSSNSALEMIDHQNPLVKNLCVIKRFSAGGTVIVDYNTIFVTFIFNARAHSFMPFPEPILRWSTNFYQEALQIEGLALKQNDYVLFDKKIGGNAQYIKKDRWLHHTTFLYDYDLNLMNCLKQPNKAPEYRASRSHKDFITILKPHIYSKKAFIDRIYNALKRSFNTNDVAFNDLLKMDFAEHRQSTHVISSLEPLINQNTS